MDQRSPQTPRIDVEAAMDEPDTPQEADIHPRLSTSLSNMLAAPTVSSRERSFSGLSGNTAFASLEVPRSSAARKSFSSSVMSSIEREDALRPDPGTERDFKVTGENPFAFSPGQLNKLQNPKSLQAYAALGGLRGIEHGLRSDINTGLSMDESVLMGKVSFEKATRYAQKSQNLGWDEPSIEIRRQPTQTAAKDTSFFDRKRIYSNNSLPEKKPTPLWKLVWRAYNDKILILLSVAAVISLALGLYETFGVPREPGEPIPVDWIEGCAIVIAIVIVVLFGSLTDYQKERAFVKLNAKKDDREVKVIRSGKSTIINVHDILAGDVLHLEPGDLVPADGIFITGHNLKCDESSATGESDALKKTGGDQVTKMIEEGHNELKKMDCFIISGSKVLEGVGTYMVTSVGVNSSYGKIMMALRVEMQPTPLQVKLDGLAGAIAKLGSGAALFLFFVLLFRFLGGLHNNPLSGPEKASEFLDILIVAVTVIVVAVPEGLPLAVTLALAFATTRLLKLNNLVRVLKSCETMGNATTVCSDKTGTLTTNVMTVVKGTFGGEQFDDKNIKAGLPTSTTFASQLRPEQKRQLIDAIALNSTAFEGDGAFVGSKTETALLSLARVFGMGPLAEERASATIVQIMPFDSARKCMAAVQKTPKGTYQLFVKGASEILLSKCSSFTTKHGVETLDQDQREKLEAVIDDYATQSLRTIALTSRTFTQWPPLGCTAENDPESADMDKVLKSLTFDGLVGIQDPVRPGVPEAVAKCHDAGVVVRMVTGDNVVTARAIAKECGIYTDGLVMEGPVFRKLSDVQMREVLPKLQVLARSSPEDKRILVTQLRALDEIVAVTGDGTNDGPALKAADVGFSMGISGTEVAKEASAIILMDDNFTSILTALMWGRAVNDAVRKFLQFQITVNITAVIVTFVSAVANAEMRSVLTAVQLLWINLIMDSLAALALASDGPTEEILNRKPAKRSAPLISIVMWKMIIGQAIFQLAATFILYYAGPSIRGWAADGAEVRSVVFNQFVWAQVFNMLNNRRLDNRMNIFDGIHRNKLFLTIFIFMIGAQIMIMFVGGRAFSITRIEGKDWAISLVVPLLCLPWAVLIRLLPDAVFERVVKFVGKPFVLIYRPLQRYTKQVGTQLKTALRRNKKAAHEEVEMGTSNEIPARSAPFDVESKGTL